MASTRELWILLRARDEASRVVGQFSKNVRAAALAAQAAQKSAEAGAIRQRAQMLKTNGVTAQQIRAMNETVIGLEKQARAQTLAAAKAREYRADQLKAVEGQVRANNVHASGLEKQARALTLAASMADEHRSSLIRLNGATNEATEKIDGQIGALRKRAATLNAEAAVARSASASMLAQLQKEQTGLDGSIRSYERRAAAIRAQAAVMRNQASEMKVNLDNEVRALTNQAAALDMQANKLRQSANAAREHDIAIRKSIEGLGKVSEVATVAAFSLAAVGAGGLVGLKSAINTTIEYDRQVRATATQVDGFGANLKELGDIGKRIANEIGVSFQGIQPALFDIFSSMEVNTREAEILLRAFSKAAVAGQVEIQDVSRATIGLLNAFHRPATDVNKILDMQFQLIQEGIGSYEEWNQRIGLVTPSAVRAGQSIEMMMAALATSTRMGMSAARSGTSVARAMDAMSHPAAVKNMEALGIKVRDADGKMRPMNQTLRQFRDVLMKMPEKDRVKTILDVFKGAGGTIEARRFIQNILLGKNNLELFDEVLAEVSNSAGSMDKAYKTMADSVSVKSELLKNKWQLLKMGLGESLLPQFSKLIDMLMLGVDWFNKLPDSTKNTISQFLLWGSVLAIVLGALFAFVAIGATVAAAIATIGVGAAAMILVIGAIPIAIAAIGIAFAAAYQKSESFRNGINAVGSVVKELWNIVTETAQGIKNSWDQHMAPPIERIRAAVEDKLLPAFREFMSLVESQVIPKIREAGRIVQDMADGALSKIGEVIDQNVVPAINKMTEFWNKHQDQIKPLLSILGQVVKWMIIIGAILIGTIVAVIVGPVIAAWALFIGIISAVVVWVVKVVEAFQQLPEKISAVGSILSSFFSSIGSWIANAWNSIVSFFGNLFNWFAQLPGRIMGFIQSIPEMLANVFREAINRAAYTVGATIGLIYVFFTSFVPKAIAWIGSLKTRLPLLMAEAWAAAKQKVSAGVEAALAFFRSFGSKAASGVSNLKGAIATHINSAISWMKSAVSQAITNTVNNWRELPGRVQSAISTVKSKIMSVFSGASTWLVGAGRDIINGVKNGILGAIGGAVDAARSAARQAVQGFKDALKIGSPSKVFAEMGMWSMKGYADGIIKETKRAVSTVSSMTADVLSEAAPTVMMSSRANPALATAGAPSRVYHQEININTNEIDPRRNAAELGWELERRLP